MCRPGTSPDTVHNPIIFECQQNTVHGCIGEHCQHNHRESNHHIQLPMSFKVMAKGSALSRLPSLYFRFHFVPPSLVLLKPHYHFFFKKSFYNSPSTTMQKLRKPVNTGFLK